MFSVAWNNSLWSHWNNSQWSHWYSSVWSRFKDRLPQLLLSNKVKGMFVCFRFVLLLAVFLLETMPVFTRLTLAQSTV